MTRIIVLEGPDFSGKSTLAARIADIYHAIGMKVSEIHNGSLPEVTNLTDYYLHQITAPYNDDVRVIDRLHISEQIYGPYYRDTCRISNDGMRVIDQMLDRLDAIRIYVNEPDQVLLDRFRGTRGDALVLQESELLDLAAEYRLALAYRREWLPWNARYSKVLLPV